MAPRKSLLDLDLSSSAPSHSNGVAWPDD